LFHADTRFPVASRTATEGAQPLLLGFQLCGDDNTMLASTSQSGSICDTRIVLEKDIVHVARTIFLWRGTAYQRSRVRNHGLQPAEISLLFPLRQ